MDLRGLSSAWVLCVAQALTTALAVLVVWTTQGSVAAVAAMYGGLIAILPALYFAVQIARRSGAAARDILGAFYRAELVKLLLTMLLFFIGVRLFGEHFAPLMLTCMACLAMNWVVLAVTKNTGV